MAIGSAIILFVIGAILTYGIEAEVAGLDITTIGYILMAAGVIGGIIGLLYSLTARHDRGREVIIEEAVPRERVIEREYRR